ncbi:MAG: DUF3631 domain-containing protein [Anaerolineales bacterium]|nr:DUF3631 domain-containing protein [Anaerolineales bacterium]
MRKLRGESQATDGQGRAITFEAVEPWPETVDGAALLDDLTGLAAHHLILPDHGHETVALWTVLTWLASRVSVLPLLAITSPEKGCGKTTVLGLLRRLAYRARSTSNVSPAALFRFVEKYAPTLLIDEADSFLRDNEEMRGILNSGHTRTSAYVIRTTGEDFEPREFSTWCPKAIAGIGRLPDTIMDRSIRLTMRRKGPGERVEPMPEEDGAFLVLRQRLARWTADNGTAIAAARPDLPLGIENRRADNWRVLLAIADAAGGRWPALAREACAAAANADGEDDSLKVTLLADLRTIFAVRGTDKLPTEDAIRALTEMAERPWTECNKGKAINSRQLSRWLGEFGIKSRDIRPEGQKNCKGYRLEDFADAFACYLPPENPRHRDNPITARVPAGFDPRHANAGVTDENGPKPNNGAGCHVVTDENTPSLGGEAQTAPLDLLEAAAASANITTEKLAAALSPEDLADPQLMTPARLAAYAAMLAEERG